MSSHYLNQCWDIVNWTHRNKLQWNFNQNSWIFFPENALEYSVWKMAAILSRPQCFKVIMRSKWRQCVSTIGVIHMMFTALFYHLKGCFTCDKTTLSEKVMKYLERTKKTPVFDILICWKWFGTNDKQVLLLQRNSRVKCYYGRKMLFANYEI